MSTSLFSLTAITTGAVQSDDVIALVDVHDPAQAAVGSTRKIMLANLFNWNTTAVTVSTPVINALQTWNDAAVTFTGLKLNVTSTASAAASLLLDLQLAGTSQWKVTKAGAVTQTGALAIVGALTGATTGAFSGAVSMAALTATTGAFSSTVSMTALTATTGAFSSTVSMTALTATTGAFSSTVSMTALTATTGAFSSTVSMTALTATTGAFSSSITMTSALASSFVKSASATGGVGYATGAGGAVTQATSKSTTVVLNTVCGAITMNNELLAGDTTANFTLTNSAIGATDVLVLNHISGGTVGVYILNAQCGAGSATINVRNNTAGNLSEAVVLQFVLLKGVNS